MSSAVRPAVPKHSEALKALQAAECSLSRSRCSLQPTRKACRRPARVASLDFDACASTRVAPLISRVCTCIGLVCLFYFSRRICLLICCWCSCCCWWRWCSVGGAWGWERASRCGVEGGPFVCLTWCHLRTVKSLLNLHPAVPVHWWLYRSPRATTLTQL